jgi:hypothetical protein
VSVTCDRHREVQVHSSVIEMVPEVYCLVSTSSIIISHQIQVIVFIRHWDIYLSKGYHITAVFSSLYIFFEDVCNVHNLIFILPCHIPRSIVYLCCKVFSLPQCSLTLLVLVLSRALLVHFTTIQGSCPPNNTLVIVPPNLPPNKTFNHHLQDPRVKRSYS